MKRSSPCRLRPMCCDTCGYRMYGTRGWWEQGFPTCPCGGTIQPTKPADLAWCGLIGPDDMASPMWTALCRENGWEDAIQRKGNAAKSFNARQMESGGISARKVAPAEQCSYSGCGRWVKAGLERCSEHSHELAAMPF
jgi:hypothetical protein